MTEAAWPATIVEKDLVEAHDFSALEVPVVVSVRSKIETAIIRLGRTPIVLAFGISVAAASPARSQLLPPSPSGFQTIAYEERWDDPSLAGIAAPLKKITLDPDGIVRLDIGGALRERGEAQRNSVFALPEAGGRPRDAYLLHRLLLHVNLRVGERFRAFVQFEDALQTGRSPAALPIDRNRGDVAQAFVEATIPLGSAEVSVRGGRQEMSLGSGRLVDIREGPNIRQRFDGVRAWARIDEARVDLFWTQPVENNPGWFDDRSDPQQRFYGAYASLPLAGMAGPTLGAYAYRLDRDAAMLDAGMADERRNTFGLRLSGKAGAIDFDFEGVHQTGRFGAREIDAYALFSDTGVTFANMELKPRFAVKADVVSGGNSRGSGDLGTFYPLFPKLNYFNDAGIQTFVNYADLFPYAIVQPRSNIAVMAGVAFQWREDVRDSFYRPPGTPILPGNANRRWYLGEMLVAQLEWQASVNLNVNASAVRFVTKGYLESAGARDQSWTGLWGTFRF